MHERAFRFGRNNHLVGVAGLRPCAPDNVGVIMLNAGLVHRIGPFRLHVEMARRFNADGYPTLRFDLSTIGDSGASSESQSRSQQVRSDVADAMALLREQAGCTRFVLVGLCSGAQDAHTVASTETDVVGAIFLDGYAYRTLGFRLRHYLPRLCSPARWHRLLARRSRRSAGGNGASFHVAFPPLAQVRADMAGMLDRGMKLCYIYSGGMISCFNHRRQFRECYGRVAKQPGISVSYMHDIDHNYILECDRNRLLGSVESWLRRNFPIESPGSPS